MSNKKFILKFKINKKDYWKFNLFHTFVKQKNIAYFFIIFSLFLAFIVVYSYEKIDIYTLIFNFLYHFLKSLFYITIFYFIALTFLSFFIPKSDQIFSFQEHLYEINEDKIILEAANQKSEYKWPFIQKAFESKNYFFCYISSRLGWIFPKKIFQNEDQLSEFRKLLESKNLL